MILKKYIFSIFILFVFTKANSQIVINEIYPAPVENQPEWIELFNIGNDNYFFDEGVINDAVGMKRLPKFILPARNYLILTKDSTGFLKRWNKSDSSLIIQLSLPTFNNDVDMVMIRDKDSVIIDSIYYNMKYGAKGISLERINPYLPVKEHNNLKPSISPDSSTPGCWNSVSKEIKNIVLKTIAADDSLKYEIQNNSSRESIINQFLIYFDVNNDTEFSENEIGFKITNIDLSPHQTMFLNYSIAEFDIIKDFCGRIYLKAFVDTDDNDSTENTVLSSIVKPIDSNFLVINEIMYDVGENQGEYVELFNSSTSNILLNDLIIHDSYKSKSYDSLQILRPSPVLNAGDYLALSWDSAFFSSFPELLNTDKAYINKSKLSLNSSFDDVVLKLPTGIVLDSVRYNNSWHNTDLPNTKSKSLEKINPFLLGNDRASWTSCLDYSGGTPGRANSALQTQKYEGELNAEPNPFSPDGNNRDRFCIINYELPFDFAIVNIEIFNEKGVSVKNLVKNYQSAKNGVFTWDGLNDSGYKVDTGPYVLIITAKSGNSEYQNKILIVIGY